MLPIGAQLQIANANSQPCSRLGYGSSLPTASTTALRASNSTRPAADRGVPIA